MPYVDEGGAEPARQGHGVPRIGVLGLGRMGLPICLNLLRSGYAVVAGDASERPAAAVRQAGGRWSAHPAEVATWADVLVTVLPGPVECRQAMLEDGAVAALRPGSTWIDLTSSTPAAAAPIRARAFGRGVRVLESPMGGGPVEARTGTLQLFVGGPADLLRRHRPTLEAIAAPGRIVHTGGHDTGYVTKLLVNLLWFTQAIAVTEALLIGARTGLDPDRLRTMLRGSVADCAFLGDATTALLSGDRMESFGLDRICDELAAVTDLAREHGVPGEVSTLIHRIHRRTLATYGPADGELLAAAHLHDRAADADR